MGRSPCCEKNGLKKGPWTTEEDQKLIDYIQKNGYGNWRTLPKNAGLQRCGKSCRLRWTNYLRPDIKRGRFSFEEEETIIHLHSILGNKWSAIASRLPGRTDNEIKNYWNTHIRKRLLRMGIDPVTHAPRLDLLDLTSIFSNAPSLLSTTTHPPSNNINFSRLLGMQNLINPTLIRLASSLIPSHTQNQDFLLAQNQPSQLSHHQISQPLIPSVQLQTTTNVQDSTATVLTSCLDTTPQHQQYDAVQNISGFGSDGDWHHHQISSGSIFSSDATGDQYAPVQEYGGFYGSGHQSMVVDPTQSSEASTFQTNGCSNNFSFQSVLSNMSTPSSSPTTFRSNNNIINNNNNNYNNNSSSCSTEDEKEISHCSDIVKFEIPDILHDVIYDDFVNL